LKSNSSFFKRHELVSLSNRLSEREKFNSIKLESGTPPLNSQKIATEFLFSNAFGDVFGLVFGGLSYVAAQDTHGDTNISKQSMKDAGAYGFVFGHAIGSTLGTIFGGSYSGNERGSVVLAILGAAAGEVSSMALHLAYKNVGTFIVYLVASPILSTFGYNLVRHRKK
jgi:hypothetical protein